MKKKIFIIVSVAVAVLFVILLSKGCGGGNTWTLKPVADNGADSVKINKINIFLDASGSMIGYVSGINATAKKNLKQTVSRIVTQCESYNSKTVVNCAAVRDNKVIGISREKFPYELNDNSIFSGQSTEFGRMLSESVDSTNSDDVSILISDCVLSFPAGKSNLNGIETLNVDVVRAMQRAKDKNLSIAIVKFNTEFNTSYYCDCTNKNPKADSANSIMKDRPYYCIFIGKSDAINALISKQLKSAIADNDGVYCRESPVNKVNNDSIVMATNNGDVAIAGFEKNSISLNPDYNTYAGAKDIIYVGLIGFNISPLCSTLGIPDVVDFDKNSFISDVASIQESDLDSALIDAPASVSRIFRITFIDYKAIVNLTNLTAGIRLLPKQSIDSINSSIFPDNVPINDINKLQGKTFAMEKVLEAIDQVYNNNNSCPLAEFKITLSKPIK
jgi:hypothetical protein